MFNRIHLIVLDSVGIGEAPDANKFNDIGAHTLGNISRETQLKLPHLTSLGLGTLAHLNSIPADDHSKGYAKKLQEFSASKDTMTGHWELMGLRITEPFNVYPNGFPNELLQKISDFSGRDIICNKPYSGTKVIDDFGEEQLQTGALIVYTSADPVLQIAAHEEIIPLEELYRICEYTREITLDAPYTIGRIIARPYIGNPGNFSRTSHRHDYALSPFGKTTLDYLKEDKYDVIAIGKINDIFNGQGITQAIRTTSNMDGVDKLISTMNTTFNGLSFTNLVDFDALYGHRRDVEGYAKALIDFDTRLPELIASMNDTDLLLITADHGNDPTFSGTDHTREFVPLLAYSKFMSSHGQLSLGQFADVGATISDNFNVSQTQFGQSFLEQLK